MSTIKNINTEFGRSFTLFLVTMSCGETVRVVHTMNESGVQAWLAESSNANEEMEEAVLAVCQASFNAMLEAPVGEG